MLDALLALAWHCQLWFTAHAPDGTAQDGATLLSFFHYLSSQQWTKQLEKCSIKFTIHCLPALQHAMLFLCYVWRTKHYGHAYWNNCREPWVSSIWQTSLRIIAGVSRCSDTLFHCSRRWWRHSVATLVLRFLMAETILSEIPLKKVQIFILHHRAVCLQM